MPGGRFLKLPTTFVDVTLSDDGTQYEELIMYTCKDVIGSLIHLEELIFSTRD